MVGVMKRAPKICSETCWKMARLRSRQRVGGGDGGNVSGDMSGNGSGYGSGSGSGIECTVKVRDRCNTVAQYVRVHQTAAAAHG